MAKRTRAKRRGGASRGRDAGPGTVTDPQAPDGSRCAIGQDTTGRQETAWPGASNLLRHPKGSNGGVHRGPDRYPRVTQAQFMRALAEAKVRVVKGGGAGKKRRVVVEMAMNADIVRGLQLIAERGAQGKNLKEFLKLIEIEEKVFRNGHSKNGEGHAPIPVQFIRAPERSGEPAPDLAPPAEPGVLQANGQEYVG